MKTSFLVIQLSCGPPSPLLSSGGSFSDKDGQGRYDLRGPLVKGVRGEIVLRFKNLLIKCAFSMSLPTVLQGMVSASG